MKYIIILLFSIGATAQDFNFDCGPTNYDFIYYYDQFVEDAARYDHDLPEEPNSIFFNSELPDTIAGVAGTNCFITSIWSIAINPSIWDSMNEDFRKYLMYHELGHAVLGRQHNNVVSDIMYPDYRSSSLSEDQLSRLFTGEGQIQLCSSGKSSKVTIYN